MCVNRFAGGMFTNELEMARLKFQEDDEPEAVQGTGSQGRTRGSFLTSTVGTDTQGRTRPSFLSETAGTESQGITRGTFLSGDIQVVGDNSGDNVTKNTVDDNVVKKTIKDIKNANKIPDITKPAFLSDLSSDNPPASTILRNKVNPKSRLLNSGS